MSAETFVIESTESAIVFPLRYDRDEFADWGWIRDATNAIVFTVNIPVNSDLSNHREQGTDPTKPRVDALMDAFSIVQRLAEWSEKYPRQQIHSFSAKIDAQLIEIEDSAKAWLAKFRTSQQ